MPLHLRNSESTDGGTRLGSLPSTATPASPAGKWTWRSPGQIISLISPVKSAPRGPCGPGLLGEVWEARQLVATFGLEQINSHRHLGPDCQPKCSEESFSNAGSVFFFVFTYSFSSSCALLLLASRQVHSAKNGKTM